MNQRQPSSPTHLQAIGARRWRLFLVALCTLTLGTVPPQSSAQSASEASDTIHGTVINAVTHEPIPRALVTSPDLRLAAMTDTLGRFEFTIPKAQPSNAATASPEENGAETSDSNPVESGQPDAGAVQLKWSNRPDGLTARKPGFLPEDNAGARQAVLQNAKDLTLLLVPEAIIAGQVSLPTSEAPDSIQLQLFRRQVQDGRAHWIPAGTSVSRSTGEFRFAELHAGTYKLLTRELLDRDPLTFDPQGQLYGYPPVYYQDAADFDSASTIEVSAGETAQANISLVKQPYYNVKIAVDSVPTGTGLNINVYTQDRHGPGYSLGFNPRTQSIDGMLPNGTYTVEGSSFGQTASSGVMTLTVKGAAVEGARLALVPGASVLIHVKEEFTEKEPDGSRAIINNGTRTFEMHGARSYLNVNLELADEFGTGEGTFLRPPKGPEDDSLVIDNVLPGRYWVRVQSSRGYVASVRSGTTDLRHEPLVVGAGAAASPIEITMRDDSATIEGNVDGMVPPASPDANQQPEPEGGAPVLPVAPAEPAPAQVYCIPLPESGGEVAQIPVAPDGSFASGQLAPGEYRLLAFDREQPQLEYRDPEAMKTYDKMGQTVRVDAGQREHVTLHLILSSE